MKDIYIFNPGRLKRKDHTLLFIDHTGNKRTLPVEQIENIHIYSEVDFNTSFFNHMNTQSIFVHMYNYYGYYAGGFVPRKKQVSGYVDVQQAEYYLNHEKRMYLAKMFLDSATHHMLRNLRKKSETTQAHRDLILEEKPKLFSAQQPDQLMGVEGQIRKIYYQSFPHICQDPFFHFEKREKRPPRNPINALISFGNSRMYTTVLGEIYKTTLNPTVSFLHQPTSKRFSLSLDLAEIFKPLIIDPLIFNLINKRMIKQNHFEWIEEACFLNDEGKQIFLREYEKKMKTTIKHRKLNRKVSYRTLVRLEGYKLVKHFLNDEVYKPLKAWW